MTRAPKIYQLRIEIDGVQPLVWRRVLVDSHTTLHELHCTIQILFDWYDYHLYSFELRGRRFEFPHDEAEGEDSTQARLSDLLLRAGASMDYVYDFGDDWTHRINIESIDASGDTDWLPWLIDGARRGPPEDCGGVEQYNEIQRLLRKPPEDLDEDARALVQWVGPNFDPEEFSISQARHALVLTAAWGSVRRKD